MADETSEGRARRGGVAAALLVALLALLQPAVLAMDPLGFASAAEKVSGDIADRVAAPLYGFDETAPQNVSASTRAVAVVLIDDRALSSLGVGYPLPYAVQLEMFARLFQAAPRAVFVDLVYGYDRGGLGDAMAIVAEEGAAGATVAKAGLHPNGLVFASIGGTVGWAAVETHQAVSDRFDLAVVRTDYDDPSYALRHAAAGAASGLTAPSAALKMLEIACVGGPAVAPLGGGAAPAPGCADLGALRALPPETRMALRWGSLSQDVWEPTGDHLGLAGRVVPAGESADGCRHFPSDLSGRLWEAATQALFSLRPLRDRRAAETCAYTLTIPLEQLLDDSPAMNAYLAEALGDKIVLVGSAVLGAHDRVPVLDSFGPGVFSHAMAIDNLLHYGADFLRPPGVVQSLAGLDVSALGLRWDAALELATLFVLIGLYALAAAPAERWIAAASGPRWPRRVAVAALWFVLAAALTALAVWIGFAVFRWPPHNWIATLLYAAIAARVARAAFGPVAPRAAPATAAAE